MKSDIARTDFIRFKAYYLINTKKIQK